MYVQHMVEQARQRGLRAVVFNGRGESRYGAVRLVPCWCQICQMIDALWHVRGIHSAPQQMHGRTDCAGTSDSPVTTPQFYSASYTEDTRRVTNYLVEEFPSSPFVAVGWSLGANILLKWVAGWLDIWLPLPGHTTRHPWRCLARSLLRNSGQLELLACFTGTSGRRGAKRLLSQQPPYVSLGCHRNPR